MFSKRSALIVSAGILGSNTPTPSQLPSLAETLLPASKSSSVLVETPPGFHQELVYLGSEISRYREIVEGPKAMRGYFNWAQTTIDPSGTVHVPAREENAPTLLICPTKPRGGDEQIGHFGRSRNEIVLSGISASSATQEPIPAGPAQTMVELVSGVSLSQKPGADPQSIWQGDALNAFLQVAKGEGTFSALRNQVRLLQRAGVYEHTSAQELEQYLMLSMLISESPRTYGEALADLSGGNIDSIREWLPGTKEMRETCTQIRGSIAYKLLHQDLPGLNEKLEIFSHPDFSALALKPEFYTSGGTDPVLSEILIGLLRQSALRDVVNGEPGKEVYPDVGGLNRARLLIREAWSESGKFTLHPPLSLQAKGDDRVQALYNRIWDYYSSPSVLATMAEFISPDQYEED